MSLVRVQSMFADTIQYDFFFAVRRIRAKTKKELTYQIWSPLSLVFASFCLTIAFYDLLLNTR